MQEDAHFVDSLILDTDYFLPECHDLQISADNHGPVYCSQRRHEADRPCESTFEKWSIVQKAAIDVCGAVNMMRQLRFHPKTFVQCLSQDHGVQGPAATQISVG